MTNDNHGIQVVHGAAHHEVHLGKLFDVSDEVINALAASNNDYLIKTGTEKKYCHIAIGVDANQEIGVYLYRDPTTTADGTQLTPFCLHDGMRREVQNVTFYNGPTVSTVGTLLKKKRAGSTNKVSGSARYGVEIVLDINTNYLLRVVPTNNNTSFTVEYEFYEDEK